MGFRLARVGPVLAARRLALVAPLAAVFALLVGPGVARASDTLDQSQTDSGGFTAEITGTGPGIIGTFSWAQTFTAGLTGGLDRVDLVLSGTSPVPAAPLTVEIRATTPGGAPGSTVLATASVPGSSVPPTGVASGVWVEVDFASPALVTSGTQYAIVAQTGDSTGASYFWKGSESDSYSGGASWFSSPPVSPPTTWGEGAFDLAFKTYVSTASDQASTLVGASAGVGPGAALGDKATAIQAAVNSGDTATACADITDFLALVSAQTGKKLTSAQASTLTTDADNLAAALGC